jgi:membrane protein required for beta-lactamase induction
MAKKSARLALEQALRHDKEGPLSPSLSELTGEAMNNLEIWLRGIAAAAVGGASSALAAWFAAPDAFGFSKAGMIAFAKVVLAGAAIPTFAYLKQSPLPASSATVTATVDVTKH